MKYMVMVQLSFPYDSFAGEYSGIVHDDIEEAKKELKRARKCGETDSHFECAYIESIED